MDQKFYHNFDNKILVSIKKGNFKVLFGKLNYQNINYRISKNLRLTILNFIAKHNPKISILTLLISMGADPTLTDSFKKNCLHNVCACTNEGFTISTEIIALLLRYGCKINAVDTKHRTPLSLLFFNPKPLDPHLIDYFLKRGAIIETVDKFGYTPFHYLCRKYHENKTDSLIHFLKILSNSKSQTSRIKKEEEKNNEQEKGQVLKNKKHFVCYQNRFGETAFHILCSTNKYIPLQILQLMQQLTQNLFLRDNQGKTVYHKYLGCQKQLNESVCSFVAPILNIHLQDRSTNNPIHDFFRWQLDYSQFKNLFKTNNFNVNTRGYNNNTLLHITFLAKKKVRLRHKIVKFLVAKCQADLGCRNKNKHTPLHLLCRSQQSATLKEIKLLIKNGADINSLDFLKSTPLFYFLEFNQDHKILMYFLKKGADPRHKNICRNGIRDVIIWRQPKIDLNIFKILFQQEKSLIEKSRSYFFFLNHIFRGRFYKNNPKLIDYIFNRLKNLPTCDSQSERDKWFKSLCRKQYLTIERFKIASRLISNRSKSNFKFNFDILDSLCRNPRTTFDYFNGSVRFLKFNPNNSLHHPKHFQFVPLNSYLKAHRKIDKKVLKFLLNLNYKFFDGNLGEQKNNQRKFYTYTNTMFLSKIPQIFSYDELLTIIKQEVEVLPSIQFIMNQKDNDNNIAILKFKKKEEALRVEKKIKSTKIFNRKLNVQDYKPIIIKKKKTKKYFAFVTFPSCVIRDKALHLNGLLINERPITIKKAYEKLLSNSKKQITKNSKTPKLNSNNNSNHNNKQYENRINSLEKEILDLKEIITNLSKNNHKVIKNKNNNLYNKKIQNKSDKGYIHSENEIKDKSNEIQIIKDSGNESELSLLENPNPNINDSKTTQSSKRKEEELVYNQFLIRDKEFKEKFEKELKKKNNKKNQEIDKIDGINNSISINQKNNQNNNQPTSNNSNDFNKKVDKKPNIQKDLLYYFNQTPKNKEIYMKNIQLNLKKQKQRQR
ncbi:ankyrin repeat-containing protein [Anaeramoeba flamelloides]|uniref:Ankyrin repeat-containing protein n=1 Tax=Anaeramoeba flamelloides TaxID=1746091 RepID=A0ABQ8YEW8_9EUKA|nr:ankyrin repeat-containing protein [Anaeramoeba flamelloides]